MPISTRPAACSAKQLKLEVGDDACDPKQARSVAEQLAAKNVLFVAGHYCSGSSIPASDVYNEAGIIQISPGSTNPKYTDQRPKDGFSYRVCGRDDQQGSVAGNYLATKFKDKNIAILDDKTAYGKGLAEETKKAMNAAGKMEVFADTITAGEKDYNTVVTKLKEAKIDVVFLGGYHTEAGLIIRQMRAQGMKTILMGGDALVSTELGQIAGPDVEGTLFTFSPDPRKNPAAAAVVKEYPGQEYRPRGLRSLCLRRGPDLERRGGKGTVLRRGKSQGGARYRRVRHRARQIQVRRQGRSDPCALRCLQVEQNHLRAGIAIPDSWFVVHPVHVIASEAKQFRA